MHYEDEDIFETYETHSAAGDDAGEMEGQHTEGGAENRRRGDEEEGEEEEFEQMRRRMMDRQNSRRMDVIEEEEEPVHVDNQWDREKCHEQLKITGTERARNTIVTAKAGAQPDGCYFSVLAKNAIPAQEYGIFYFKVTIKEQKGPIFIGFCAEEMPVGGCVGEQKGTYAYGSDGTLFKRGHKVQQGKPKFGAEDSVGCGVNLRTGQIILMKNDQQLDTANLTIEKSDLQLPKALFPCVTLTSPGDKIIAKFKFKKGD